MEEEGMVERMVESAQRGSTRLNTALSKLQPRAAKSAKCASSLTNDSNDGNALDSFNSQRMHSSGICEAK